MTIERDFVINTIKKHRQELKDNYPLESLELFGSVARSDSSARDIDLLLIYDKPFDLYQFMHLKEDLEQLLGVKVDLVSYKGLHPVIRDEIEKDLIRII